MAKNIKAQLEIYHQALNNFDIEKALSVFASDAEYCSPGIRGCLTGKAAITTAFRAYFAEFTDQIAHNDETEVISPLQLRTHWQLEATSRLSGRTVRRRGVEIATFNAAGLITRIEVEDVAIIA